MNFSTSRPRSD